MSDNQKRSVERALDVFVYAPLGLALLARDSVPTLVHAFAARGRAEVDSRRRAAESKVEQARTIGRFALDYGAPVVRRRVESRLNDARTRAGQGLNEARARAEQGITDARTRAGQGLTDARTRGEQGFTGLVVGRDEAAPTPAVTPEDVDAAAAGETARAPVPAGIESHAPPTNGAGNVSRVDHPDEARSTLSIPDYDELSASQVVQRLPGLSIEELEAIRAYETRGRGRRTILGKIDQLAR